MSEILEQEISDVIVDYISPSPYLGDVDADVEWEKPIQSAKNFIHTDSYKNFIKEQCLYLFGRRGTGKTALIHMFDFEIQSGKHKKIIASYLLDPENTFNDLSTQIRGSVLNTLSQKELVNFLINRWHWVITFSAMLGVYYKFSTSLSKDDNYKSIKKYVESKEEYWLKDDLIPLRRLTVIISRYLDEIDNAITKLSTAITKITNELSSPQFNEAKFALKTLLRNNKGYCAVLIDSLELYDLNDPIAKAVTTSLITAVREIYKTKNIDRIIVKVAFPTEIYPHLQILNKEKVEGRNLFILWKYKDLVCLLAKRFCSLFKENDSVVKMLNDEKYSNCRDYLYGYLPITVTSAQDVKFDTLAYIIRHTQKKPRQVIMLLNVILTLCDEIECAKNNIAEEIIVKGVHKRLDMLCEGSVDIYNQIYNGAVKIVNRILNQAPCSFNSSELDRFIAEASSLRNELNLSVEDVKRLLLSSGAIGIERGLHEWPSRSRYLIKGLFEYQVKTTISVSNRTHFLVHPMFYQNCKINIDKNRFVYPYPAESEELDLFNTMGITLK